MNEQSKDTNIYYKCSISSIKYFYLKQFDIFKAFDVYGLKKNFVCTRTKFITACKFIKILP